MRLPFEDFIERLAVMSDVEMLCEVLELEPEDILERFSDIVETKQAELRDVFDVDLDIGSVEDYD